MDKKTRKEYGTWKKGYYHLCLDRLPERWIFHDEEDYRMGMSSVALAKLKIGVEVYAFELMPNHLHEILSGTGKQCLKVFSFYKLRFTEQLIKKGYSPLPESYGFKLIPIENEEALRKQILYTVRNPYEKDYCIPGTYKWGAGYLFFSEIALCIRGKKVSEMSQAEVRRATGSKEIIPPNWEIHPELGVLPKSFVRVDKVLQLFPSAKVFLTRLVKDYETVVFIARTLNEEVDFSIAEVQDMANTELANMYPGRKFKSLSQEEKCSVVVKMHETHGLRPEQLAKAFYLSELVVRQVIRSKDFGSR